MGVMDKIHIWIGVFTETEKEYWDYFDQSQAYVFDKNGKERDENDRIFSNFSKDIGLINEMYDPDFIGNYYNKNSDDLDTAINETPDSSLYNIIKETCIKKGINKANAVFYYTDGELKIKEPDMKYNGLTYIGCFDWN